MPITHLTLGSALSYEFSHLILMIIHEVGSTISPHFSGQEISPKEVKLAQGHITS